MSSAPAVWVNWRAATATCFVSLFPVIQAVLEQSAAVPCASLNGRTPRSHILAGNLGQGCVVIFDGHFSRVFGIGSILISFFDRDLVVFCHFLIIYNFVSHFIDIFIGLHLPDSDLIFGKLSNNFFHANFSNGLIRDLNYASVIFCGSVVFNRLIICNFICDPVNDLIHHILFIYLTRGFILGHAIVVVHRHTIFHIHPSRSLVHHLISDNHFNDFLFIALFKLHIASYTVGYDVTIFPTSSPSPTSSTISGPSSGLSSADYTPSAVGITPLSYSVIASPSQVNSSPEILSIIPSPVACSSVIPPTASLPTFPCNTYIIDDNNIYALDPLFKIYITTVDIDRIDALAYNSLDGYLYGTQHTPGNAAVAVIRIGSNGETSIISHVTSWGGVPLGGIDSDGQYWLGNSELGQYWVVDLDPASDKYMWTVQAASMDVNELSGIYNWGAATTNGGQWQHTTAARCVEVGGKVGDSEYSTASLDSDGSSFSSDSCASFTSDTAPKLSTNPTPSLDGKTTNIGLDSNGLGISVMLLAELGDASNSYTILSFACGRTGDSVTSFGRPTSVGDLSDSICPNVGERGESVVAVDEVGDVIPAPSAVCGPSG
ncbi:hypothetical protein QBC34DRAFT_474823 [Podospora aff. communis PSN243]|uniref:DUF6923 domain-containing protein n=1 Tax=Podospora aff. communis PSN243 TaxID=3040156 RepID=A0AAV9GAU2_9PEZI|nr:hypothetical protein QBC34DRAFT_474823 [Podospora aff. communis PSN243]